MRRTSLLAVLAVGVWYLGACGGDTDGGKDAAVADTVATDTTPVDTVQTDTTPIDTVEPDTVQPDTVQPDTVQPDTVQPDTGQPDTVDTDTVTTDADDTTEPDTSTTDTTVVTGFVATKHDNCTEAGVAVGGGTVPFSDADNTGNYTNLYTYSLDAPCQALPASQAETGAWGAASPDVVYALTPDVSGSYVLTLDPVDFDPGMMITTACGNFDSCLVTSDQPFESAQEVINIELTAGTTYYVFIMGWDNDVAEQGAYTFTVSMGEICDNGVDDNNDAAADCADPLCADAPSCDESNTDVYGAGSCVDGSDNDDDGDTDCADSDCSADAACDEGDTTLYPNGCSDAPVDNDGDGLIDCADPDCAAAANCDEGDATLYPNGCANVDGNSDPIDDDGDGLANCADPDCDGADNCDEGNTDTYPGGCTDSADNDGDGLTDCDDDDCDLDLACLGQGDTCADPFILEVGVPATYNTADFSPVYGVASDTCPGDTFGAVGGGYGTGSKDVVFSFTPTTTAKYHFSLTEDQENEGSGTGDFDNGLYITTDCETIEGHCLAAWETEFPPDPEEFIITLQGGVTYFIIVDGWSSTTGAQEGQFTLTLSEPGASHETLCADTLDDDADDDVDCDDVDCFFDHNCVAELCADGIDNDNDGLTDCDDDELDPATGELRCPAHLCIPEVCDSGQDDDGDGLTDCADEECALFVGADPGDTCAANGDVCALPFLVDIDPGTGTYSDSKNLCDFHNAVVFSGTSPSTCKTTSPTAGDVVYAYTTGAAPENVTVKATPTQSFNLVLNVTAVDADCGETMTSCVASVDATSSLAEQLTFAGAPNTTYLIMVDVSGSTGACTTTARQYTLSVTAGLSEAGMCGNSTDDDGDGLADCFDPDCAGDAACPTLGGSTCDAPIEVSDGVAFSTNTCNYTADFRATETGNCEGTSSTSTAKDFVVKFTAPNAGPYEARLSAPFDSVFNVVKSDTCPATPLNACVGGVDTPDLNGVVSFEATAAGEVFWVVVDGWGSGCGLVDFAIVVVENEATAGPTACSDGVDNDTNGLADCYDPACKNDAACGGVVLGGSCDAPIVLTDVAAFEVNTCSYDDDFTSTEDTECENTTTGTATAPDYVVEFIAPSAGPYVARLTAGFDSVFNVVSAADVGGACPATPINNCVGGWDDPNAGGVIGFEASAPGDVFYVIVDGYSTACGLTAFAIEVVEPEAGNCDDGIDNNFDGDTDCEDSACAAEVACDESSYTDGCTNDTDDDGDGDTDCDDSNCADDPGCDESLYTDGCTNDSDDDGDGATDCDDSDCALTPSCDEATYTDGCSNTADDDGDGFTDCDDWNCKTEDTGTCTTLAGDVCGMPDGSNLLIAALPFDDSTLTTCDFDADHTISSVGGCKYHDGSTDVVYEYLAPSDQKVQITLTATDGTDTVLNVSDVCPGNALLPSCLASADVYFDDVLGDTGESVQVQLVSGQRIYIYVNAYSESDCMPFQLTVEEAIP